METIARAELRRRSRHLLPGGLALLLSSVVHGALLPLIGLDWGSHALPPEEPEMVVVTLAWTPPAAAAEPEPEPQPVAETPTPAPAPAPAPIPKPAPTPRPAVVHKAVPPTALPQAASTSSEVAAPMAVAEAVPPPPIAAAEPPPPRAELLSRYSRLLLERLERHKTYPALSQRRGEEGTVTVRLILAEDGRLVGVEAVGDGPSRLVEASLAAVQASAPFPPLPSGLGGGELAFNLPITYRLH